MNISINKLAKAFSWEGGKQQVLKDLSIVIPTGSFATIMGASGSGKSTLLGIIGGQLDADDGEVYVGPYALHSMPAEAKRCYRRDSVGFVFQKPHLLPELSIIENLTLPLELMGGSGSRTSKLSHSRAEKRERALSLLQELGIADFASKMPWMLSGGEQQRVAIARALMGSPALILADEPTGNLDEVQSQIVQQLLIDRAAAHGASLIVVTHDSAFAARGGLRYSLRAGHLEVLSDE